MPFSHPLYILCGAIVLAFLVTYFSAPPVIAYLLRKKFGQQIRDDGPQRHLTKAGTPTMGGVVILAGVIAGTAVSWAFCTKQCPITMLLLFLTIAAAGIGSIDDWEDPARALVRLARA